jgi:cytochrome bd-type quinol oxidase subunit 1
VTGILRTQDAVGDVGAAQLGASLTGYILTYSALLIAYFVVITHLAAAGDETPPGPASSEGQLAIAKGAE